MRGDRHACLSFDPLLILDCNRIIEHYSVLEPISPIVLMITVI